MTAVKINCFHLSEWYSRLFIFFNNHGVTCFKDYDYIVQFVIDYLYAINSIKGSFRNGRVVIFLCIYLGITQRRLDQFSFFCFV